MINFILVYVTIACVNIHTLLLCVRSRHSMAPYAQRTAKFEMVTKGNENTERNFVFSIDFWQVKCTFSFLFCPSQAIIYT